MFSLFDRSHFIWLLISAAVIACPLLVSAYLPKDRPKAQARLRHAMGLLILAVHILQAVCRIREGSYDIGTLPIHFCAVTAYFCVVHTFFPASFLEGEIFFPGLPGAVLAIVFSDWTEYAPFSALSVYGFLGHALIAGYIILLIRRGALRPCGVLFRHSLLFLGIYAALVWPFDRHFSVNYGFLLRPAPGSPLELLSSGGVRYTLSFLAILILLLLVWYAVWGAARRARGKAVAKQRQQRV